MRISLGEFGGGGGRVGRAFSLASNTQPTAGCSFSKERRKGMVWREFVWSIHYAMKFGSRQKRYTSSILHAQIRDISQDRRGRHARGQARRWTVLKAGTGRTSDHPRSEDTTKMELTRSAHSWSPCRYPVATATASSTLSTLVPLPMLVGALPPALPPTTPETAFAQSVAEAPFLLASWNVVSC